MKKIISVVLILCVAASLFASTTVKVGLDFGVGSTTTPEDKTSHVKDVSLKAQGFGFDIAVIGDIGSDLAIYGNVSAIFPTSFKTNLDGGSTEYTFVKADTSEVPEVDGSTYKFPGLKVSSFALRAGALYKMDIQGVDLGLGGGLVYNVSEFKAGDKNFSEYQKGISKSYGLSLYATGTYMVSENMGINLTVSPDIYFYNYSATLYKGLYGFPSDTETCAYEAYGVRLGFACNASVGVTYSF